MPASSSLDELIAQLGDSLSPKRRSAAKRLRKLGDSAAGPALLEALEKELKDARTWETQYQMIMALGECGYCEALCFVEQLAARQFEATMVYVAIGDALVRLSREHDDDAAKALELIRGENEMLADGALRAVAMLRMKPSPSEVGRIVSFGSSRDIEDSLRFWIAAAAAGWTEPSARSFLEECARSPRKDIQEAAVASLAGTYKKWNPL